MCRVQVLEQHSEFVPPVASHRVPWPYGAGKAPPDLDQELVPGPVPKAVIDGLEPVQVHQEDPDRGAVARGAGERLRQPVIEEGTVSQTRQTVGKRLVGQLLLERPPLRDVRAVPHQGPDGWLSGQVPAGDGDCAFPARVVQEMYVGVGGARLPGQDGEVRGRESVISDDEPVQAAPYPGRRLVTENRVQ